MKHFSEPMPDVPYSHFVVLLAGVDSCLLVGFRCSAVADCGSCLVLTRLRFWIHGFIGFRWAQCSAFVVRLQGNAVHPKLR